MNIYLVEFVDGGATRRVRAEGWLDDGRSYLMLDRFRVDHDARFEHTEVVELFAKAELIGPPRLVERATRSSLRTPTAWVVSEPSRSDPAATPLLAEQAALPDIDEQAVSVPAGLLAHAPGPPTATEGARPLLGASAG
jgi:hypothetical protein